jgi:twitching motility protein PilT
VKEALMVDIIDLLRLTMQKGASDLHLVVGAPPMLRTDGSLEPVDEMEPLSPEEISEALIRLTTPEQREKFHSTLELDFGYTLPGVGRFRCNAAQQRGAISFALRFLPPVIPSVDALELPQICKELALRPRGLVIVTGPTGSGKTTTLAAMVQHINANRTCHILIIEDPIEYTHSNFKSVITQRELESDTLSFGAALRHALRQDPDVILVGEMRDLETAAAVLTIAETGHLVLSTGHAPSAVQAIERIVDLFPPAERYLAQTRLASLIIGVLCQALVPRAEGGGRIAAVEIMLGSSAVKNLIREGKIHQLLNVIRMSNQEGMVTLDQALIHLYLRGTITGETMFRFCNDAEEVERLVGSVGGFVETG